MNYPSLTLTGNSVSAYRSSERGDMKNCYSPLQNLDRTETGRGAFTSKKLNWNQYTPVQMDIVPEYDGSVNIIIDDDINDPKLINSGFSVQENNTYLIPEHLGNAVTNIYEDDTLKGDVALFKLYDRIPTLTFNGLSTGGQLQCGSYTFYFRLADADKNVTNVVQESGIVQVYMGDGCHVRMGQEDENTHKQISFTLTNLDKTFDYVRVFFERTSSGGQSKAATRYYMIDKNYPILNSTCDILITGAELMSSELTLQDLQTTYADIQTAKTQAISNNVLFLGNVSSYEQNYKKLRKLAWKIIPREVTSDSLGTISSQYQFIDGSGYYDAKNVYYYTGYWPDEIYRFAVVFIYGNNQVSNAFDLQGCDFQKLKNPQLTDYQRDSGIKDGNKTIYEDYDYDPDDHIFNKTYLTNSKGVFRFSKDNVLKAAQDYTIQARGIAFDFSNIIDELNDLDVKGLFFVRQKRMPTILGQGVVIGLTDKDRGSLPVLKTNNGYITKSFLQSNRLLGGSTVTDIPDVVNQALLFPDGELQEGTYNDLINSEDFWLEPVGIIGKTYVDGDHYSMGTFSDLTTTGQKVKLTTVPQGTKNITNGTDYFSTIAGYAEDALQIVDVKNVWNCTYPQDLTESVSLVRGQFGYYVGMSSNTFDYGTIVNVRQGQWANPNQIDLAFEERFTGSQPFFAVSPRYNLSDFTEDNAEIICYRGDCFSSIYTHKMMNNFADIEYPTNTTIVDPKCWAKNFVVRATAIRSQTSFSNCKKSNEGFFIDPTDWTSKKGETLDIVNGIPPFQNSIAEEVTIDVINYPVEIGEGVAKNNALITDHKNILTDEDTSIVYSEDVMIGEESDGNVGDPTTWAQFSFIPFSISALVAMIKRANYSNGITRKDAYSFIRLEQPQPFKVGFKLLDAFIKVQTSKQHNYVKRGRSNINRSDVNAVSVSQWVTFPICSSINLALRDVDYHNDVEEAAHNRKRSFYPYEAMDPKVHLLEAKQINYSTKKSVSNNIVERVQDYPFYKQEFFNRIYWSKPNATDAFINSYRLIYNEQMIEYNKEWGSITKLVPYNGNLLVVFQHGMGMTPINLAPATELESSQYVASKSVLQAGLIPISTDVGSVWQDSIIAVNSNQLIFGVDTVAKKIWQLADNRLTQLSDLKVEKFLIDYIDLSEFDFNEYLGHVNVKTHFNAFKNDVIFTFYKDKAIWALPQEGTTTWNDWVEAFTTQITEDAGQSVVVQTIAIDGNKITVTYNFTSKNESKTVNFLIRKGGVYDYENRRMNITPIVSSWETGTTWSLCYNLLQKEFTTFYDWYPLLSENIDNVWFTFDKEQINTVLDNNPEQNVVTINNPDSDFAQQFAMFTTQDTPWSSFVPSTGMRSALRTSLTGTTTVFTYTRTDAISTSRLYCTHRYNTSQTGQTAYAVSYWFKKSGKTEWTFCYSINDDLYERPYNLFGTGNSILLHYGDQIADIRFVTLQYLANVNAIDDDTNPTKYIPFSPSWKYYHLQVVREYETMKLWKHGQAGLYDGQGKIKPTHWYGKQHEFNFEFVAKDDSMAHKIWDNLVLISNKAEPGKFEFEVVGEVYDWHEYKPIVEWINAQEEDKDDSDKWWKYVLGKTSAEIQETYPDFPDFYYEEQYNVKGRVIQKLPYLKMKLTDKKGTPERPVYAWDDEKPKSYWERLNAHPDDKFQYNCSEVCLKEDDDLNEQRVHTEQLGNNVRKYGRVRGNMEYREDNWKVEIRPIQFEWCYLTPSGAFVKKKVETRIRDKYVKIKVRYSGEDLALITAIGTLFEDSHA